MVKLKIKFFLVVATAMMVLGGCGMYKVFRNQEEARQYLLRGMEEKYGESFTILKERYENYGIIHGYAYICTLSSAEDANKIGDARVNQRGWLLDNWATNYFEEEVEEKIKKEMRDNDVVKLEDISLLVSLTHLTWDADTELKQYLEETNAKVEIIGVCEEGLEDTEYAEAILDFVTPAYRVLNLHMEIHIKIGKLAHFSLFLHQPEPSVPTITVEYIAEEIKRNREFYTRARK